MAQKVKLYAYLDQRLKEKNISIAAYAAAIGQSKNHVQECFSGRRPWSAIDRAYTMALLGEPEENYARLFPAGGIARPYPQAAYWRDGKLASSGGIG